MSFIVVDASVWVARLVPQDVFFLRVKTWMEQVRTGGNILLSPALLLVEVSGAISRRTGKVQLAHKAIESLQSLPGVRLVEMDRTLVLEAANLAATLGLRGADSFYVAVAAQLKVPLATLDEDQGQRATGVIDVQRIGETSIHR